MSDLRSNLIRLAASMPEGSSERKALLEVLAAESKSAAGGGITPEVIAQIAEMTDQNDHGGAVALLAESLGDKKTAKVMEHVMAIHHVLGGMPHDLITFRNSLLKQLLEQAKRQLDTESYQALNRAF